MLTLRLVPTPCWVGCCLIILLSGCTTSKQTSPPEVFVNPGDAALVASSNPGGAVVFGTRDDQGIPNAITEVAYPSKDSSVPRLHAYFGLNERLERALYENGDSAAFEYVSATRVYMTLREVSSHKSARIPIDAPTGAKLGAMGVHGLAGAGLKGTVDSKCGVTFVNGLVQGSYQLPSDTSGTPLAFTPLSGGGWEYSLPSLPVPQPDKIKKAQEAIAKLNGIWKVLCGEAGTGSGTLDTALGLLASGAADKICAEKFAQEPKLVKLCVRFADSLSELCPLREELLQAVEYNIKDKYSPNGYKVSISVSYPETSYPTKSFSLDVTSSQTSIPPVVSTLPTDQPAIMGFTVTLSDPAPLQGYTVSAETLCAKDGTVLRLSISGSDEYSKSIDHTITVADPTATLYVPGAEEGVTDTLTAKILPNGPEQTFSVVF